MKINVVIDCTPAEAREFYGLPDVRELQASVLRRLEERLMSRLDALSPEAMLQNWFAFNANGAQEFVSRILGGGFGVPAAKKTESTQP
ncbi:MAG TPA: DUF6489 family protein [Roseiarcus sp.]|nr:DUF6489 family protein [Roseiarcus sp.]